MPIREPSYTISPSPDSTIAVEVFKTGVQRGKKHTLFFDNFEGQLWHDPALPEASRVSIRINARTVTCRDAWLKRKKQQAVTDYVRNQALKTSEIAEIRFESERISLKPLRGFVVDGHLSVMGSNRPVKANVVLSPRKNGTFQIDGDATISLADFGIMAPVSWFGLVGTRDDALVRFLLWAHPVQAE
jgi:polyisoprenoid-binding protein YceI